MGTTADAVVGSSFFVVPVLTGECVLGAGLASYSILLIGELLLPFSVGLYNLFAHVGMVPRRAGGRFQHPQNVRG